MTRKQKFVPGDRVRVSMQHHWACGVLGTVARPPRQVEMVAGAAFFYWVDFDTPQIDADGDGPYSGGEIIETALDVATANGREPQPVVLARYSLLKVGAWVVGAAAISLSILREGLLLGWRAPEGSLRPDLYYLGWGAAPLLLGIAAALAGRFLLSGGVAIARDQSNLVLNFPLGRRRIALSGGVAVFANTTTIAGPNMSAWFKAPPAAFKQVTFARAGSPDIRFRTALLTESPDVIARRIAEAVR